METKSIKPLDLQSKRLQRGETQESLASLLGITRQQVQNYESGRQAMPLARSFEVSEILDGLTFEYRGTRFEVKPLEENVGIEKPAPLVNGWENNAMYSAQQAMELLEWYQGLANKLIAISNGRGANEYLVRGYKEAREAQLAVEQFLDEGRQRHPELVDLGIEMARYVADESRRG